MKKILLLFLIATALTDCKKEDHVNPTLVLNVVDKNGAPVSGAIVNLFASQADYNANLIKETFTSGSDGKVSSTKAEYASGDFYAEALKDDFIVWPALAIKGGTNDYKLVLADNNYFKQLVGSHWVLSDVIVSGTSLFSSVSACSKDNYLVFNKDQTYEANEGASLCAGMSQSTKGTYLPTPKDPSALVASGSVLVYPLGSSSLGFLAVSSNFDRITLTAGTSVNVYRKP